MFDSGIWYAMMFAYAVSALSGIVALIAISWLGSLSVMCLSLGAIIESREWHRIANTFAYMAFVQERVLDTYRSDAARGRN